MNLCVDFQLEDAKPEDKESLMNAIKQLFCIADFVEASNEANTLLFSMASKMASIHGPSLQLVDVTAKTLSLLLETSTSVPSFVNEAVSMMSLVLTSDALETQNETMMTTLRLQIDSLLAAFNHILCEKEWKSVDQDLLTTLTSILECSQQMAKIDDWAELVGNHFAHPSLMLSRYVLFSIF